MQLTCAGWWPSVRIDAAPPGTRLRWRRRRPGSWFVRDKDLHRQRSVCPDDVYCRQGRDIAAVGGAGCSLRRNNETPRSISFRKHIAGRLALLSAQQPAPPAANVPPSSDRSVQPALKDGRAGPAVTPLVRRTEEKNTSSMSGRCWKGLMGIVCVHVDLLTSTSFPVSSTAILS